MRDSVTNTLVPLRFVLCTLYFVLFPAFAFAAPTKPPTQPVVRFYALLGLLIGVVVTAAVVVVALYAIWLRRHVVQPALAGGGKRRKRRRFRPDAWKIAGERMDLAAGAVSAGSDTVDLDPDELKPGDIDTNDDDEWNEDDRDADEPPRPGGAR
jgi:hypothetical protein